MPIIFLHNLCGGRRPLRAAAPLVSFASILRRAFRISANAALNTTPRFSYSRLTSPTTDKEILFYMFSHSCRNNVFSPFDTHGAAPHFGKGIPHTSKNRPACCVAHIGHEENYLKCSSPRLKCSFGLLGALNINHIQRPKNRASHAS